MIRRPPRSTRTDTSFPTRRSSDRVLVHVKPPFEAGKEALQTSMLYVKAALHARKTRSRWPHLRLTFGGMLKAGLRLEIALRPFDIRSEEHTSELQSLMRISYAVFCLKKKNNNIKSKHINALNHYQPIYITTKYNID